METWAETGIFSAESRWLLEEMGSEEVSQENARGRARTRRHWWFRVGHSGVRGMGAERGELRRADIFQGVTQACYR
jgi:hypothetical protein